jgi:transcriptional regulator with XRE-family HTH domain
MTTKLDGAIAAAIGVRIRARRAALALSQPGLHRATGLAPEVISRFENGHVTPSAATLMDLARAMDTSVAYLLGVEQ